MLWVACSELGRKRISGVFRVQGTCLVAASVVLSRWGANCAPPNPLTGFEGATLRRGGREEKGSKGG